jgi:hypothetical protein
MSEYRSSSVAALWLTAAVGAVLVAVSVVTGARGALLGGSQLSWADVALLTVTLVVAQYILFLWKQLAGVYTIHGRALDFAKYLTLVYLSALGPRIVLTWAWGALGFCLGLVAYYGSQVLTLGRVLETPTAGADARNVSDAPANVS